MRRDAHGLAVVHAPFGNSVLHQFDRIQDSADVFATNSPANQLERIGGYSLRTSGVCGTTPGVPLVNGVPLTNKPTPDLVAVAPYGSLIFAALRGPVPITVGHAALGSCPGLGVIRLDSDRRSGTLVAVFNTTILGADGRNLSDNHDVAVVRVSPCQNRRHSHHQK